MPSLALEYRTFWFVFAWKAFFEAMPLALASWAVDEWKACAISLISELGCCSCLGKAEVKSKVSGASGHIQQKSDRPESDLRNNGWKHKYFKIKMRHSEVSSASYYWMKTRAGQTWREIQQGSFYIWDICHLICFNRYVHWKYEALSALLEASFLEEDFSDFSR